MQLAPLHTGCGSLREAALTCPALTAADCTFCLSLEESFFTSLPTGAPALAYLSLASCPGLQPRFLASLRRLPKLASLDLSYTYITAEHLAAAVCPAPDGEEDGGGGGSSRNAPWVVGISLSSRESPRARAAAAAVAAAPVTTPSRRRSGSRHDETRGGRWRWRNWRRWRWRWFRSGCHARPAGAALGGV